ncbi:MAG: ROK family protein, partial [Acidobacteriota bacterium]
MIEFGIGVDLGGTNLRAAAIDRVGNLLDQPISVDTNYHGGRDAVIGDIVNAVSRLQQQFASARLAGVGIGVPGFIRLREGFITNSNNLPYLENFPVRDEIEKRLGTPIILENDANAAALGETWQGAGLSLQWPVSYTQLTLPTTLAWCRSRWSPSPESG